MSLRYDRVALLLMVVIAMASSVVMATAANADPSGCANYTPTMTETDGYITAEGDGYCSFATSRAYRVEIKASKGWFPDPLVASDTQYANTQTIMKT